MIYTYLERIFHCKDLYSSYSGYEVFRNSKSSNSPKIKPTQNQIET